MKSLIAEKMSIPTSTCLCSDHFINMILVALQKTLGVSKGKE